MPKKFNPKKQTSELNRARLEFLKRNPEKFKEFQKLLKQNKKKRDEHATDMATISGKCNQELKKSWNFILSQSFFDKKFKEKLMEIETPPAANTGWHFLNFAMAHAYQVMTHGGDDVSKMTKDVLNQEFLNYLTRNAREIFTELTNGQPSWKYLFVGIDLSRTKEVIIAEVSDLVTQHQDRSGLGLEDIPQKRFKWLSIVDDLLKVWDSWIASGEPARRAFPAIAKRLNIPESTVKARWHMAHVFIFGKPYEINAAKRRDQATDKTLKALCLRCEKGVCGKKHGGYEIGCPAYVKMAGKNSPSERTYEKIDKMSDKQSYKSYLEHDQDMPKKNITKEQMTELISTHIESLKSDPEKLKEFLILVKEYDEDN